MVQAVGERSRVAASVTHERTAIYGCKPRRGGRGTLHSAAPTGLDVLVSLHRGRRLRLTALRLPTAVTFRAHGAGQSVITLTRLSRTLAQSHCGCLPYTTITTQQRRTERSDKRVSIFKWLREQPSLVHSSNLALYFLFESPKLALYFLFERWESGGISAVNKRYIPQA